MDNGKDHRFVRRQPLPCAGDRFGELTVIGIERHRQGSCEQDMARVQCSCGAEPHLVYPSNLRRGRSTRCNKCAKKQSGYWRKHYFGYADICPDAELRRSLLSRIAACINRCHSPGDKQWPLYGGRGIHVHEPWRTDRKAFLAHLVTLENHSEPGFDLDRIDNNKGYEPGNLRFVSRRENSLNRRTVRDLQKQVDALKRENADLRHRLLRAEKPIHGTD